MIANFVLNGLESAAFVGCKKTQRVNLPTIIGKRSTIKEKVGGAGKYVLVSRILVRFAGDFLVITTDEKAVTIVEKNIKSFLDERGIGLGTDKLKVFK